MPHNLTLPLAQLSQKLACGECSARQLVDAAFTRIEAADDPAHPVFVSLYREAAIAQAEAVDAARARGAAPSALAGIPFAAKDLFDVQGETTRAGATVLDNEPPASANADAVQRLLDAGLVLVGKTNMTEFAFSGLGLNPHYGTPPAWGTAGPQPCAPGGSSSGAGVSIAAGMVPLSLGTDTAGSCRIPAAWNGVVGYKPTQSSVSRRGAFPLSPLLDAPGPLARTVACCHTAHQLLSRQPLAPLQPPQPTQLRLAVPSNVALNDLHPDVERSFNRALERLAQAGANIAELDIPEFDTAAEIFGTAPLAAFDAWAIHRDRLASHYDAYDPFVARRISSGQHIDAATQERNLARRRTAIESYRDRVQGFDAVLMPTTADTPPLIAPLRYDLDAFAAANGRALRNTSLSNFVDGCAITLPCHRDGEAAVGLSLCQAQGQDERLFAAAAAVELLLEGRS